MATPRIVQRQLEEAETLARNMNSGPAAVVVDNVSQLNTAEPPPVTPVEAAPPLQPSVAPAPPAENWEQKYRTLQGMYQAEVPALRTKAAASESTLTALQEQVRVLVAAQKAQPPVKQSVAVVPEDVERYGADMLDMVNRYAAQVFASMKGEFQEHVVKIESRISALESTIAGVNQKTDTTLESQFFATLASLVPDWEKINVSDEWLAWLAEVDPVYGVPRQAALDAAHKRGDVRQVSAVFNMFKSTRPAKPSDALASQVQPNGSGGGNQTPAATPVKQLLSQKFVQSFFTDVAKGRYRGREAEEARITSEINMAAAEGRIV
jgi:hypothetical protein